ncbi:hypothetical protein N7U66_04000 [Lacinutrix neustonica]|uniref:DNA ligase-associated DEXH box helicase n=1 Tax=Lacinutrix neustonica TaxID=2980107 RepID=A0A9E8MWD2_9FLAO|nr:hypothetical protein [Lacinutrix neustonica]WAC02818.1 hypothetical protein N7U66_04000 [Lacinutrix neustonica]
MKFIKFTKKGIYCIPGRFYLDPWYPVDHAIISHGHADHARWGNKKYFCHHHSKAILQHRIGGDILIESMGYNETRTINQVKVSFHPAGHIIGSAQIRLEYQGEVVVFTGDYKTQADFITEPFEPVKCHTFITESTFGLPIYHWKTEQQLQEQLHHWVLQNQTNNKTSVFIGYSLGKSQRIISLVDGLDTIYVHRAIHNINQAITSSRIHLPKTTLLTSDLYKKDIRE